MWPVFAYLGGAVVCLCVGLATLVVVPWRENRDLLGVTAILLAAAVGLPVAALVAWSTYQKRHAWKWGEAELVMAVWSIPDDVSGTALSMLLMPFSVMLHGLDLLVGHFFMNRMFVSCQRPVGNRVDNVKVNISYVPEGGKQVGYTWICRSVIWPRRWYALGDIVPGGTINQVIPDDAVAELSEALGQIRRLSGGKPIPSKPQPRSELRKPKRQR